MKISSALLISLLGVSLAWSAPMRNDDGNDRYDDGGHGHGRGDDDDAGRNGSDNGGSRSVPRSSAPRSSSSSYSSSSSSSVSTGLHTFFGFGPSGIVNTGAEGTAYHLAGGVISQVNGNAAIRVIGESDFQPTSEAGLVHGGVGVMGFLTSSDISPYVGGDFGYGVSWGTRDQAAQFAWGLSAGVQFFRTSSTQLGVEARVYSILDHTNVGIPYAAALQMGVYF